MNRKQTLLKRLKVAVESINRDTTCDTISAWKSAGFTDQQVMVLSLLRRDGEARMGELSDALGISKTGATSVMDRMYDRGLVERYEDSDDRRVVRCKLTEQGQREADQLWSVNLLRWQRATESLGDQQLEAAVGALEALREQFGNDEK